MKSRIAIVAALPRELRPLVRNWKLEREEDGVAVYSSAGAVAAFAGMGADRTRLAVTAALGFGPVHRIVSAGWAGGLHAGMKGGMVEYFERVINAGSGEILNLALAKPLNGTHANGGPVLLTVDHFASVAEKRHLHERYAADMVDMEAAVVAGIARDEGLPCVAIKAVSDEYDFDLPGIAKFSTPKGQFREGAYAAYIALRPGLWKAAARMGRTSSIAANRLCAELERYIASGEGKALASGKDEEPKRRAGEPTRAQARV